jgi:hypothetical protein
LWYKLVVGNNDNMTPADSLAIIESEQRRLSRRVQFNPALINAMWAAVWFVGFGVAYLGYGDDRTIPGWLGATVPTVLIIGGMVVSIAYGFRTNAGISGPARTAGAMYGWCWTIGFVCLAAVNIALGRHLSDSDTTLLWSATSLLLVGVLQASGAALFRDVVMFATGIWTMLCAGAAALAGVPGNFLVLAFAGGGGFALLAVYLHWRHR